MFFCHAATGNYRKLLGELGASLPTDRISVLDPADVAHAARAAEEAEQLD